MVELTTVQIKAHRVAHFMDNMGMDATKAAAHAEVSESEWPEVEAEVQRMKETPEERAVRVVSESQKGPLARIEADIRALRADIRNEDSDLAKNIASGLEVWRKEVVDRFKRLEDAINDLRAELVELLKARPVATVIPPAVDTSYKPAKKQRKKMVLSDEERERRRERGRALAAARWAKKEPAEAG